jgi:hypothetical protein
MMHGFLRVGLLHFAKTECITEVTELRITLPLFLAKNASPRNGLQNRGIAVNSSY